MTEGSWERIGLTMRGLDLERKVRVVPCVCGGQVRVDVRFPNPGMSSHQRSKRHQAWRQANGL